MRRRRTIRKASVALLLGLGCLSCLSLIGLPQSLATATSATSASGEDATSHWRFSKPVELGKSAPYQELFLDEEVYGEAAADLSDLRIVDGTGKFVPFYREDGKEGAVEQKVTYASKLIHRAQKELDTIFDYEIAPVEENSDIEGSKLVFGLPQEAFLKHVQVYGSYDGNTWQPLAKGDLYFTDGLAQNSIELGSTYKFSHYRLVVQNNAENLDFGAMQLVHNSRILTTTDFRRIRTPAYEIKQEGDQTEIVVRNNDRLRMSKVILESTGNFTRAYELLDDSGRRLRTEGSGKLYRLDFKDARIAATDIVVLEPIALPSFTIVIYNHDDAPIRISEIRTEYLVDKLVFAAGEEGPYRLLYGNSGVSAPQYDIVNFKTHIEEEDVALAKLGSENASPKRGTEPPSKPGWFSGKTGFNAVIIAVSLLLIIVLIRKMNRQ